jgi:hypothetical protein
VTSACPPRSEWACQCPPKKPAGRDRAGEIDRCLNGASGAWGKVKDSDSTQDYRPWTTQRSRYPSEARHNSSPRMLGYRRREREHKQRTHHRRKLLLSILVHNPPLANCFCRRCRSVEVMAAVVRFQNSSLRFFFSCGTAGWAAYSTVAWVLLGPWVFWALAHNSKIQPDTPNNGQYPSRWGIWLTSPRPRKPPPPPYGAMPYHRDQAVKRGAWTLCRIECASQ